MSETGCLLPWCSQNNGGTHIKELVYKDQIDVFPVGLLFASGRKPSTKWLMQKKWNLLAHITKNCTVHAALPLISRFMWQAQQPCLTAPTFRSRRKGSELVSSSPSEMHPAAGWLWLDPQPIPGPITMAHGMVCSDWSHSTQGPGMWEE